jgi:hypothetical protein
MTEIQAGNNFSVSTRFVQEVHKAASDSTVDAKELARLVQVASEDTSGLTDAEKSMLKSLFTEKLDTSGLSPEEKALFDQISGTDTTQEVVDQNIQALKSVSAHENDPNSLNFSKLQLVTESRSILSRASFGLFGGTNKESHNIALSDGNIPAISNPSATTGMTERRETDRNNLISMMGPLEQELTEGLKPDSDVRKRLGESLGLDPNSAEVTEKIEALSEKITAFKDDPQKEVWTSSEDLTTLMNSYAKNPPTGNPRINSAYMSSLMGTYWNAWDSSSLKTEQKTNFQEGAIQTPPSVEEINQTLKSANDMAATDAQAAVDKASTLIAQLDALKSSDPALYEQLMRGKDESAVDLLRAQVSDLKQHMSTGGAMGQAQMTQLNNLYANLHQMGKTFAPDAPPPVVDNSSEIKILQGMIDDPITPEEIKTQAREKIAKLESQVSSAPVTAPSQPQLDAIRATLSDAKSAASMATLSTQDSAKARSNMVFELEQAESTLANILSQHGLSDTGRAQLQAQLDTTRAALTQLKNNQDVKFENPEQQASLNKVLQNLQQLRPAPVEPPPPPPVSDNTPITGDLSIGNLGVGMGVNSPLFGGSLTGPTLPSTWQLGGGIDLGMASDPSYSFAPTAPEPLNFSAGVPPLTLNQPFSGSLGYSGVGGSGSLMSSSSYLNLPSLYSPSFGYGGFSGGLGGYDPFSSSLSLPSLGLSLTPPVQSDSSSPTAPQQPQATAPRNSLANVFLEGVGENPANLKPLSPEMEQRQAKALETIAEIEKTGSSEAKEAAKLMKALVANPNSPIQMPDGSTIMPPPGSFESTLSVLETYTDLTAKPPAGKGIAAADAEAVFIVAANVLRENGTPAEVADSVRSIAQGGSKEQITAQLQQFRKGQIEQTQQNISLDATKLGSSQIANDLATTLLGPNFKDDPNYLSKLIQHPDFQKNYDVQIGRAQDELSLLNQQATDLVGQVQRSGLPGARNMTTVDQAIEFLKKNGTTAEHTQLQVQLEAVNTTKAKLEPQIAGIRQLAAVSKNYTTMTTEMESALTQLRALPDTPVNATQIAMVQGILDELKTKGQLSPANARHYADFKVGRQMNTLEAELNRDSRQTGGSRREIMRLFNDFRQAGTPAEKDAVFTQIIDGLKDGSIIAPNGSLQDAALAALGLPGTNNTNLTPAQFLERIQAYKPSRVIEATIVEHGIAAAGNDLARYNLTGEPPIEEIADRQQTYVTSGMTMRTDPESLQREAATNPIAGFLVAYNRATEDVRQHNYSLPEDQQAAAWAQTASEYAAANNIINTMDANISASIAELSLANDNVMVANGYPPLSSSVGRSGLDSPKISQKAQELVDKADELATRLLAPVPTVNGEQFLSDLLNAFIKNIRDLDLKTRQLVLQQLAQKMVNNAITQFYKDKLDENNKHHQESLQLMQENFKAQITQTLESSLASQANSTQGIAAMSGQVTGANLSGAMDKLGSTSAMVQQMFEITDKMSPPLSDSQKMRILNQVNRVMAAAGTPDLRDDQMALNVLNNDLSANRFNR